MDTVNLPKHVAIIMDGNGRWAQMRSSPRTRGHLEGVNRVEEIISAANKFGIKVLTLYTFSTENWSRPANEVGMLMQTLVSVLAQKIRKLHEANIRFQVIGRRNGVPVPVLNTIDEAVQLTKDNTGLVVNMAFNYGGRQEILDAIKSISTAVFQGDLNPEAINEELVAGFLYTKGLPDPDLLIRTSGEMRISNFLLWQLSYAEFYFTEKFWPDFTEDEFRKAIEDFQGRKRRYGNVS